MRLRFEDGKQRELIFNAKGNLTWRELAQKININPNYLSGDLKRENVLLDKEIYDSLCKLGNIDYSKYIIEELGDNWGKVKGGKLSPGSTKEVIFPKKSIDFAEFYGIMLGDGNLTVIKRYRVGVYQIRVVGDSRYDRDYLINYVKPLIKKLFNVLVMEHYPKKENALSLTATGKRLAEFLIRNEFLSGDKIKNGLRIPAWIKENPNYLRACIRGLVDTDGSVHHMSNKNSNLMRINFTNCNRSLMEDFRDGLFLLGFNPSKIIRNKSIFLSRQKEVSKYLKEVGFSNKKHRDKLVQFKFSPVF